MSNSLFGATVSGTFGKLVQTIGGLYFDGFGNPLDIGNILGPTGPQGATGPQGPPGNPGQSITLLGSYPDYASFLLGAGGVPGTYIGDSWSIIDTGDLYTWSGISWFLAGNLKGPAGATGSQGPAGATGADGMIGATGSQGPTGSPGLRGATGATGATGPQGTTGPEGPVGATGPEGPVGATGLDGATGATGPMGSFNGEYATFSSIVATNSSFVNLHMQGNLLMASNSIAGVGQVNGVTIQAHASRHLPNGADPLTTGVPSSIGTTNQEGIQNAFARQDHIHAGQSFQQVTDIGATTTNTINTGGYSYPGGGIFPYVTSTFYYNNTSGETHYFGGGPGNFVNNLSVPLGSIVAGKTLIVGDAYLVGATASHGLLPTATIAKLGGSVLDIRNTNSNILAGDMTGAIQFTVTDDTSNSTSNGYTNAMIKVVSVGTPGTGSAGDADIIFSINPGYFLTEQMRLTSSGLLLTNETANTLTSFDNNKKLRSLSTTTYPSLTELSYVKGVTSSIQPQIDAVNVNVITLTTSISIDTNTTSGGYGQHGRHNKISNGANAINLTVQTSSNADFVASYEKIGTSNITFVAGTGATLTTLSGTAIMSGVAGSKACLSRNGTIYYLQITNY